MKSLQLNNKFDENTKQKIAKLLDEARAPRIVLLLPFNAGADANAVKRELQLFVEGERREMEEEEEV